MESAPNYSMYAGKIASTYQLWDWQNAMHAITELCYSPHSPKFGPAGSMLIARLCIYRIEYANIEV